jgi:hypothetical protein
MNSENLRTTAVHTPIEEQTLAVASRYVEFYADTDAFVQIYTEDCVINGGALVGREALHAFEKAYQTTSPNRTMEPKAIHVDGNVAIVEGVILDPDREEGWNVPFSAVLTIRDGLIASDYTYAEFSKFARG